MTAKEECEKALEYMHFPIINTMTEEMAYETLKKLINEHFENNQIDWLRNCMGEEAFNFVFSSEEEVKKWIDRVNWHLKKVDELGRELQKLKSNPPLKFEELKPGMWVWDAKENKFNKIIEILENNKISFYYVTESFDRYIVEFEENRFYRKQVEE